ncbi:hypothetical protein D4764_05G0003360 [Takifugu flavidus]|uniref:Uncharacterized protein n=1 Tax=Takifugu flavidus TaxID=433684 RepID=A0A5C6MZ03_9TELE|nr:hypothetical protein D4764_05G0003360 [Takifugu flavidus]
MFSCWQFTTIFWVLVLVSHHSSGYELQDTIHNLEEENIHLQHQLENLTHALKDLKHLLTEHSKGLNPETHQMLKQALCLPELHGAAKMIAFTPCFLFLSVFFSVILLMT